MIKPTIGRRVWYWPSKWDLDQVKNQNFMVASESTQACDAGICCVWNDRLVNLTVADHNGKMHSRTSVRLLQDDETPNPGEAYAQWMPYQVNASTPKTEHLNQVQRELTDALLEKEIQEKGLTAPRVRPQDIEANIVSEHYFTAEDGVAGNPATAEEENVPVPLKLLTFCVLLLRNGFTVTGESACASPQNFDAEIGQKIARQNAIQKVWPLMGYALREKLAGDGA